MVTRALSSDPNVLCGDLVAMDTNFAGEQGYFTITLPFIEAGNTKEYTVLFYPVGTRYTIKQLALVMIRKTLPKGMIMKRIWGWGLTLMLFSCTSIENRYYDLNTRIEYSEYLNSLKNDYGEGRYYSFDAVNFTETGDRQPSLARLKKLIRLHANIPVDCKKNMEIIDSTRNLYEGGGESIIIKCSE